MSSRLVDGMTHTETPPHNLVLTTDSLNTSLASEDGTSSTNNTDWNALYDMLGDNQKVRDDAERSLDGHLNYAPQPSFPDIPLKVGKNVSRYIYGEGEGEGDSSEDNYVHETADWQSDSKILLQLAITFGIEDLQKW